MQKEVECSTWSVRLWVKTVFRYFPFIIFLSSQFTVTVDVAVSVKGAGGDDRALGEIGTSHLPMPEASRGSYMSTSCIVKNPSEARTANCHCSYVTGRDEQCFE